MNRKWWLVSAASALLALTVAACGSSNSGSSVLSGTIAGAGSSAQQAAQEAWIAKFEDQNSGRDGLVRPDRVRRRPRPVHRGRQDGFRRQRSPFDTSRAAQGDPAVPSGGGELVQIPNYISPIADHLQPLGRRQPAAHPGHDREDLQGRDHDLGRPRDQGGQPGRGPAEHEDHAGASLG